MALYCFAAYCIGLLPLVVALMHWDDAQYRGKNDHNEAAVTMAIIAFMIWPWRRWRRLLESQNVKDQATDGAHDEKQPTKSK